MKSIIDSRPIVKLNGLKILNKQVFNALQISSFSYWMGIIRNLVFSGAMIWATVSMLYLGKSHARPA
jgi:hypothetical protein